MKRFGLITVFIIFLAMLSLNALAVDISITGDSRVTLTEDDTITTVLNVKNTGSNDLTGLKIQVNSASSDLKDDDNNIITITFSPETFDLGNSTLANSTLDVTLTIKSQNDQLIGDYSAIIEVLDGSTLVSNQFTLDIEIQPELCEDGELGQIKINDLDIDEDEYAPGDTIQIEVDVDNDYATKDVEDIQVEALLYDITEGDELDSAESERFDLDDGDSKNNIKLELQVPDDADEDNEFRIFVRVYEDGNEDENCRTDSETITIERNKNDVIVDKFDILPASVKPGESAELSVNVLNIGSDDQDDVTIEITNRQLGISLSSERFGLDRYDDSDDSATKTFTIKIPETAEPKDYSFEIRILDEDNEVYDKGTDFFTLTVSGTPISELQGSLLLLKTDFSIDAGKSFDIPITIKNTGQNSAQFILTVAPTTGWAMPTSEIIDLNANAETTIYPKLTVEDDISADTYTALITLKSKDKELESKTISVNVGKETGLEGTTGGVIYQPTSKVTASTIFWIVGIIAIVVIIIYFLKLIFTRA